MTEETNWGSYADISQCLDEWLTYSNGGRFTTSELWQEFNIRTDTAKKHLRDVLYSQIEKGTIERAGDKHFRRRRTELTPLNWAEADPNNHWDITTPLGLERWIKWYPGVYLLAGATNSGKTGFFNDLIMCNYHKHDIHYFVSDMGEEEMRERFELWREEHPSRYVPKPPKWSTWVRSCDFHDVVVADAFNIIDYLEVYDSFWEVAQQINQIDTARGEKGIVFLGLQKKKGDDLGRGGSFSLEKPKAYFSMDFQKLKIQKSRARAKGGQNPNGLVIDFKLHRGARFEELGHTWPE